MKALTLLLVLVCFTVPARPDSGTLTPRDKQAPDPSILSLDEMRVDITIDNGDAHVSIVQIFTNHTPNIEEGAYRLALPSGSTVSDFAVWDGAVRIPAVILERKRAEQVYDQARLQAVDPGLLEAGERDNKDPRTTSLFGKDRPHTSFRHQAHRDRIPRAHYRIELQASLLPPTKARCRPTAIRPKL